MQAHELGDRLGSLEWVVGAPEEVLGRFAPAANLVELDDPDVDRDARERAPVTRCPPAPASCQPSPARRTSTAWICPSRFIDCPIASAQAASIGRSRSPRSISLGSSGMMSPGSTGGKRSGRHV
jgi:hypothetical protein